MLGRTNVVQRRRPTINGDIQNFVVASGNTIAVGDFVSYKFGDLEKNFDQRTIDSEYVCICDKQNGKYLYMVQDTTLSAYVVYLLQVSGNNITILDTLTCSNLLTRSKPSMEGGNVYVPYSFARNGGTSTKPDGYDITVKHYAVVNDEFVAQTDISFTVSKDDMPTNVSNLYSWYIAGGNMNYFSVCVKENHIFLVTDFAYKASSGSSYVAGVICVVYKVSSGTITFESSEYLKSNASSSAGALGLVRFFCYLDRVVIFAYFGSAGYSLACYDYDDTNEVYTLAGKNNNTGVCVCDGRYVVQCFSGANVTNYVYDLMQSGFTSVYSFSSSTFVFASFCGDGKFVWRGGNYLKFLYINGNTFTVFTDFENNSDMIYILPYTGEKCFYLVTGLKYGVLNINFDEQTVQRGYFDGTVESYSGDYTVGFAKTGGTAGDTIQVYTPHQSS